VLVIDDGELARIRGLVSGFGADLEHLRGTVHPDDLTGPFDLVIATVRRILDLEGCVDLASLPGKPVWIAVHSQDFLPLRVRLQKLGVRFLVQSSVSSEPLRLLLVHALYRGPERRDSLRLPVGMPVACRGTGDVAFEAELLDLTLGGCRLLTDVELPAGAPLSVDLPAELAGGADYRLPGRIQRSDPHPRSKRQLLTLRFENLGSEPLELLKAILEGKVIGTVVTRLGEQLAGAQAAMTVPAAGSKAASSEPQQPAPARTAWPHHRAHRRAAYTREVTALLGKSQHVILGRDLSIAGMRAEPLPELAVGTRLELAIYGVSGAEPVLVQAVVARDDGQLGTVFHFTGMADWERPRLEEIIARAPEIQSLSDGDAGEPVVVSRVSGSRSERE
jgi:hypothetical protein